ncbi:septum formation initiator family protein [Candidatus Nomurabacteria bacterium]|uniref:Septum formation initiator family protein n=1 Tax=candidate division WWE3 bacterium TaxID=2053526 RepID=A0A955E0D6_UNCKA|nr:septum formation initiator family protein [candidate division WWE3 bacterium]MCB9823552.1 septum formation initiator family protein [Candidatus Nomurabacteria bacterium]MCB9827347.1 septum formation initiator family protein [Candidatus Nomurabacteria bacterium]HXK52503.1 septum formation initiator family protein [bacterium]
MINKIKYIFTSILLLILSVGFLKSGLESSKGSSRSQNLENEVIGLRDERDSLKKLLEYQKTDSYIEEEARNKLNMLRPGERVYVYTENVNSSEPGDLPLSQGTDRGGSQRRVFRQNRAVDNELVGSKGNFEQWVDLLK